MTFPTPNGELFREKITWDAYYRNEGRSRQRFAVKPCLEMYTSKATVCDPYLSLHLHHEVVVRLLIIGTKGQP